MNRSYLQGTPWHIIKVASKYSESRIVIDKNKSHEHFEIDLKR